MSHNSIFIGNLPPSVRAKDLSDIFSKFGQINDIDIKLTSNNGNFAFLEYNQKSRDAAHTAIFFDQKLILDNRKLTVELSKKKFMAQNKRSRSHERDYRRRSRSRSRSRTRKYVKDRHHYSPECRQCCSYSRSRSRSPNQNRNVYVSNLPVDYKKEDLEYVLGKYGTINSLTVKVRPSRVEAYAFVVYERPQSAHDAINCLRGFSFYERHMQVRYLKEDKNDRHFNNAEPYRRRNNDYTNNYDVDSKTRKDDRDTSYKNYFPSIKENPKRRSYSREYSREDSRSPVRVKQETESHNNHHHRHHHSPSRSPSPQSTQKVKEDEGGEYLSSESSSMPSNTEADEKEEENQKSSKDS